MKEWPVGEERTGIPTVARISTPDSSHIVQCPICEEPCVHVGGFMKTSSSREGYYTITFDGECGHSWFTTFNPHKGNIFVTTTRLPDNSLS